MFKRILIANRGEIAVRVIRACRELGIESVAVFSEADRAALHVRAADYAVAIGPSPAPESYLKTSSASRGRQSDRGRGDPSGLRLLLRERRASRAPWPAAGMVFIGPPPDAIEKMGDKVEARKLMAAAGVPVVPGSPGTLETEDEVRAVAKKIGFPIMLKAAAGGGGKGMRLVEDEKDLASAVRTVASEAKSSFGDGRFYVEKFVKRPRHIEVQVFADRWARRCTCSSANVRFSAAIRRSSRNRPRRSSRPRCAARWARSRSRRRGRSITSAPGP